MNRDFSQLTSELSSLTQQLKRRCIEAEARVADLQRQVEGQNARIATLEAENLELDTKYHSLQSGLAATGGNPEQIAQLKEQYLAMVSEIDACIATLQHG